MLTKYICDLFVPLFIQCCQKYNIEYDVKNNGLITKSKFFDYQFNGLAIISKNIGSNREKFAMEFFELLKNNCICDCELDKNSSFINITIKNNILTECFSNLNFDNPQNNNPADILIDYSSPNIAKELHVGHLRSTIIGDSLANIYEYFGHRVLRMNHIGNWGGQFGMVIVYAKKHELDDELLSGNMNITQLMEMYQKAKFLSKTDEDFKNEAKKYVLLLQSHDPECIKLWEIICQISRDDYQNIYQMLNIKPITEIGESFYNPYIPQVIDELKQKELLIESNGAFIIKTKNHPIIIIKSDGGYTYDTTDITAIWYRTQILKIKNIIYLTDIGQRTHFEGIFEIAQKMNWIHDGNENIVKHLGFGLVLKDGSKISSRINKTDQNDENINIKLKELLNDSIAMAKEIWIKKSIVNSKNDIKKKYLESRDANGYIDMAINSVKYYDLSHRYQSNYNFNKHDMIKFDGNTASYIIYIYARLNNILKKKELDLDVQFIPILDVEKKLGLKILEFNELMKYVCDNHQLHLLVEYVYDLANNFSSLWNNKDGQIINSPHEQSRLFLCSKLKKVFEIIFGIFGMKLLDSV
jgi:arginyl-tRNA synthetase